MGVRWLVVVVSFGGGFEFINRVGGLLSGFGGVGLKCFFEGLSL